jgi:hypothetical protein
MLTQGNPSAARQFATFCRKVRASIAANFPALCRQTSAVLHRNVSPNWPRIATPAVGACSKVARHARRCGQGDVEVAMTKLMLAVGVISSLILFDPGRVINRLGPEAQWLGWKIKTALSTERALPHVAAFVRGQ